MPRIKTVKRGSAPHSPGEKEETSLKQPRMGTAGEQDLEPGRPYQGFVENEARKYRQETDKTGGMVEPDRQAFNASAPPDPGTARRNPVLDPALNRAHMAVNAMRLHAAESGWIEPPYALPEASPNYVEALVQLADDAGWLAREVPLPEHPDPQHPAIYYTIDETAGRPVPRADGLLRGDYVYRFTGRRISNARYIHPWKSSAEHPEPDEKVLKQLGRDACYVLRESSGRIWLEIYSLVSVGDVNFLDSIPLGFLYFSPVRPPVMRRD